MLLCVSFFKTHHYDITIAESTSNTAMIMVKCGNIGIIGNITNVGIMSNVILLVI